MAIKQRGELRLHEILLSGITMDYKESGLKKGGNSLKTRQETRREEQKPSGGNVGMGWDGMRWDAMGWGDGMGCNGMGWDEGMRGRGRSGSEFHWQGLCLRGGGRGTGRGGRGGKGPLV